ncbi:MAG TPA: glycoside hydrolase family 3 protein [Gaiellaceae bacterium]|jgi:beta-N-acetylhexosaminidase|nr:glycoside hydrolase family 3 protein [Gaiellaceae bacterium]
MSDGGLGPAAAACLFPGFDGTSVPDWLRRWLAEGLGGVVLFARNVPDPEQTAALCADLRRERPRLLVAIDEEGGDVTRLEAAAGSSFPGNLALGAVDDVALTRRVAAAIAGELASVGIDLDLAPVADVVVDPANPIVGVRSFGSDPELVARHVAAFVEGVQSRGVAACAKHFPGHGETEADSHVELPVADADRVTLLARALPPFAAAVEAGVRAVMTAHIRFPALGGDPATLSPELLGLLRDELGFKGLVVTDALEMRAISGTLGVEEGAVRALAAGADALCLGAGGAPTEVERAHASIVAAVRSGRLPEERLQDAAARAAETSAWTDPRPHHDREAGAEAARRAVRVEGDLRLQKDALVLECRPQATIAAGESGRGLAELLPSVDVLPLREGDRVPDARGRQLVLVVRDAHRHPWQRDLFRPGAIVVETGYPAWRPAGAAAYVATYGAGRVNLEALAERL